VPSSVIVISAALMILGFGMIWFAPRIQRSCLRQIGRPRNRLVAWSRSVAESKTSLLSIRGSGAICVIAGFVLLSSGPRPDRQGGHLGTPREHRRATPGKCGQQRRGAAKLSRNSGAFF
jgi:hypothetical protein